MTGVKPDVDGIEKRKHEYLRFGKRKHEYLRFGKRKHEYLVSAAAHRRAFAALRQAEARVPALRPEMNSHMDDNDLTHPELC